MPKQLRVMISSTARDLPEHRKEVMDACLRQGMFPIMMEHLPASDDEAIPASLRMVDEADIYLLILAHRYGYVPTANNPERISVTEHEYKRALERTLPILTFAMHKDHPLKAEDVEKGEGAVKLEAFKNRALLKGTNFFKSPPDLRADVINSLSHHREADLTTFHYISDIPAPPEKYIAHPYTLLQTHTLIGRQSELRLLTDWITGKELEFDGHKAPADSVRIMNVVAIGGMGKSALTWKWFNDVAPREMKHLAGRMWWSFYESDATFENFVTRSLAYATKRQLDEIQQIPAPEREAQLLAALDHEPLLFVLDGLERILIAYARMDAARLDDSEVGKEKNLRKTADPRVGGFLKKLAQVKQSRVLVSSRLYPVEMETSGADPIPGSFRIKINGLTDEDAVELWRAFGVSGSRDELLPVFNTFAKHPLLIQALAGEVKRYRKAPGDFAAWRKANPRFDPGKFSETKKAMAHVLEFALRGLNEKVRAVLHTMSAFRMPTSYDTVTALLVGKPKTRYELSTNKLITEKGKLFWEEKELDAALSELEDRGLVGWDKRANRYDLHPIVRGVVWNSLSDDARHAVHTNLHAHFEAVPMIDDYVRVNSIEDLTPAIELYSTLIGLSRYDAAEELFYQRFGKALLYRLSANYEIVEYLEMLFPDGLNQLPRLHSLTDQAFTLNTLALGYHNSGRPRQAAQIFRRAMPLSSDNNLTLILLNLSDSLRLSGAPHESEFSTRRSLIISRELDSQFGEASSLMSLGSTLATRGNTSKSKFALQRSLRICESHTQNQLRGVANSYIAQTYLRLGEATPYRLLTADGNWL